MKQPRSCDLDYGAAMSSILMIAPLVYSPTQMTHRMSLRVLLPHLPIAEEKVFDDRRLLERFLCAANDSAARR